ncbi:hypothetical protein MLD52_12695 [Puniceicoccaceae bacterium K14]|nr:hypothetical protein [Puniceicoccaceae bacterium K14]
MIRKIIILSVLLIALHGQIAKAVLRTVAIDAALGGGSFAVDVSPHEQSPGYLVFSSDGSALSYLGSAVTHINFVWVRDGTEVQGNSVTLDPTQVANGTSVQIRARFRMEEPDGSYIAWQTGTSEPIPHSSAPDPCGPLTVERTIVNDTEFYQVWEVREEDPSGAILLESFTLGALSQRTVNIHYDEICHPISIVQISDQGTGGPMYGDDSFHEPDAPDPIDQPDYPDVADQQTTERDLDFSDTPLYDIASDEEGSDIEKEIEADYYIWQRIDERQQEIVEALGDIESAIKEDLDEEGDELLDKLEEIEGDKPGTSTMESMGADAGADHASKIPDLEYTGSFNGGNAPVWNLSIRGITWNLNPFQFSEMQSLASWVRAGFAFFFILSFGLWAHKDSSEYIQRLPQIQQARGNTFGGTGGQATALIAAGLITTAISVAIIALTTWITFDFGLGDILSIMGANPFNGTGSVANGVWLLDQFIPLGGFVASIVGRLAWKLTADTAYVIVASAIRFIVP